MKVKEMSNGQIFEICTLKEFIDFVKMSKVDIKIYGNTAQWIDENSSLSIKYKNGSEISIGYGDELKNIKVSGIFSGVINNASTEQIYNANIYYNTHYEDYNARIKTGATIEQIYEDEIIVVK